MSRLESAQKLVKEDPAKAESVYKDILSKNSGLNDAAMKEYEGALMGLGELYRDQRRVDELAELVKASRLEMSSFAKAKTAKIVRALLDFFTTIPDTLEIQISVTKSCIEWAIEEKRNFLKQNLETRLIGLLFQKHSYQDALALVNGLLRELKRLDDKMMLVEVQLLESRIYHAIRNIPKARAALTSARTSAHAVYCPPLMQAGLDMQSGILHTEDKDYNTAYSYFIEALEGYSSQEETSKATSALKYMLLTKIMLNLTDDVDQILTGKAALKYMGRDVEAMKAISEAHKSRSLAKFEQALLTYKVELSADPFIRAHFTALYNTLLEQNLVRVIEPFSRVEIEHVAKLVGLDTAHVENKLSQMILDKMFSGVLDQGTGCLIIFDEPVKDRGYEAALDTINKLSNVVDVLYTNQASSLD
ncbi:PCI-domain-containing protein [Ascobolus immersus RN42]|uniref:PCI-domain-containing protein n=1 Tax=Ascobolus immersus RN42 TaxID=1160509 RepID=A0A3N4ITB6_ASCIM|nr:PCI-domain-containing protein [Ascobolus immersus RN42]